MQRDPFMSCRNPCWLHIHLAFTYSIGPSSVLWSELGPAPPCPPMRVLIVLWSRALSLVYEVAFSNAHVYFVLRSVTLFMIFNLTNTEHKYFHSLYSRLCIPIYNIVPIAQVFQLTIIASQIYVKPNQGKSDNLVLANLTYHLIVNSFDIKRQFKQCLIWHHQFEYYWYCYKRLTCISEIQN